MPRKPQVRYFPSRGAYYCQIKGQQCKLAVGPDDFPDGPTYQAANAAYFRLMEMEELPQAGNTARVRAVLDAYLQSRETKVRDSTLRNKVQHLRLFAERYGNEPVSNVKPMLVEQFFADMRRGRLVKKKRGTQLLRWRSSNTEALFLRHLSGAFAWAVRQQIIPFNPVLQVERPRMTTRARENILTKEERERVRTSLPLNRQTALRNLIVALEDTGARPGELANARAADFNHELGAIVYHADDKRRSDEFAHKTSKRKDRVIYFTGEALALVKRLVKAKRSTDLLFPTQRGKLYGDTVIVGCFRALRERLGLPHLTAYAYRHTFATEWLMAGRPIEHLAELLGNSAEVIRKNYSHLCKQYEFLRSKLEEFKSTGT